MCCQDQNLYTFTFYLSVYLSCFCDKPTFTFGQVSRGNAVEGLWLLQLRIFTWHDLAVAGAAQQFRMMTIGSIIRRLSWWRHSGRCVEFS